MRKRCDCLQGFSEVSVDWADKLGPRVGPHGLPFAWGYDESGYAKELGWQAADIALVSSDAFDPLWLPAEYVAEAAAPIDVEADELGSALTRTLRPEQFAGAAEPIEQRAIFARTAGGRRRRRVTRARRAAKPAARHEQEALLKKYVQDFVAAVEERRAR